MLRDIENLERHFQRGKNQNNQVKEMKKDKSVPRCREFAYVKNFATRDNPGNTVSVIDTEKDRVTDTISSKFSKQVMS